MDISTVNPTSRVFERASFAVQKIVAAISGDIDELLKNSLSTYMCL